MKRSSSSPCNKNIKKRSENKVTKKEKTTKPTRGPGRPKKKVQIDLSDEVEEKLPGDASFPITDFSLTVTKVAAGDVPMPSTLDCIHAFLKQFCIKGAVSTEVGSRAFHLHLQGVFRVHYPKTAPFVNKLQKFIKNMLPNNGIGLRVLLKVLVGEQTFVGMLGYVTKDSGKDLNNLIPLIILITITAYNNTLIIFAFPRSAALPVSI